MRYFFDYTTKGQSLLDYQGDEFLSSHGAIEFAETIAQLLTNNLANDWDGWTIEVHNSEGKRLFSLQIGDRAECLGPHGQSPHPRRARPTLLQTLNN